MKERALLRPALLVPVNVSADWLTAAGLVLTVAAALAASQAQWVVALVLWIAGRVFDGLDGVVARLRSAADDFGGYVDLIADTIGYAAIPIGIAAGVDTRAAWIAVAVLLGAFYLNTMSWTMLSVIIDRRGGDKPVGSASTAFVMPPALIEGTETMMFYALFLIAPRLAPILFVVMAIAVSVNVVQRLVFARSFR